MCDLPPVDLMILRYLMERPHAQDTLEGIAEWWVMEQCVKQRTAEVRRALAQLTDGGFLLYSSSPGASPRYRVNPRMTAQIRRRLDEAGDGGEEDR